MAHSGAVNSAMDNGAALEDELEVDNDDSLADAVRPSPVVLANWALVGGGAACALSPVIEIWRRRPEYHDRFLIPLAGLWIAYKLLPKLRSLPTPGRGAHWGFFPFLLGVASFDVAWYLLLQAGSMRILAWWLLASVVLTIAGLVAYQMGWRQLRLLTFSLAFNAFCLPLPGKLHGPLERGLKEITTQISARGLPLVGIPTVRSGHVLILPSGELGVEDACSGIRSFSALMAIACLVAYWRGFGLLRGGFLMTLTIPIVVLANGARVITTGILQEKVGRWSVEGWAHEALGFLVVLVGLALILAASHFLQRKSDVSPWEAAPVDDRLQAKPLPELPGSIDRHVETENSDDDADSNEEVAIGLGLSASDRRGLPALAVLIVGGAFAVAASAYLRTEPAADIRLADLPNSIGRWSGFNLEVPEFIKEQLVYDRAVNRIFRSPTGHDVSVWIVYWSSTDFIPGPHNPDICWPSRGWQVTAAGPLPLESAVEKTKVAAEFREYARGGREQFLAFWTQENNVVLESMERNIEENIGDKRWILDALLRRKKKLRPSKMFVLIGAESWGSREYTRKEVVGFVQEFIDELYKVAPDSKPGAGVSKERLHSKEVRGGPEFQIDKD